MVQVRLLTKDDYPLIVSLLKGKSRISNTPVDNWDWNSWEGYYDGYFKDPESRIIGCFDEGVLKSFVIQKFITALPMWIMSLIAQESSENWLRVGHGEYLNHCLLNAVSVAEEKGVFDVMYSVPVKWLKTTKRTQPTSPVWSRYEVFTDAIIPADTLPEYKLYRYICGETSKPHDRAIKKCSLKMEYRSEYINRMINKAHETIKAHY